MLIQLIHSWKTKISLPKFSFPHSFSVTFTENNCSNTKKSVEFFEEITFLFLKNIKRDKCYALKQHSLIIIDTFKGQDNNTLRELWGKNNCDIMIVPDNLTNMFQPSDLSVNEAAKHSSKTNIMTDLLIRYLRNFKIEQILSMLSSKLSGYFLIIEIIRSETLACKMDCLFVQSP